MQQTSEKRIVSGGAWLKWATGVCQVTIGGCLPLLSAVWLITSLQSSTNICIELEWTTHCRWVRFNELLIDWCCCCCCWFWLADLGSLSSFSLLNLMAIFLRTSSRLIVLRWVLFSKAIWCTSLELISIEGSSPLLAGDEAGEMKLHSLGSAIFVVHVHRLSWIDLGVPEIV